MSVAYPDAVNHGVHRRGTAARLVKFHAPEIVFGIGSLVEAAHADSEQVRRVPTIPGHRSRSDRRGMGQRTRRPSHGAGIDGDGVVRADAQSQGLRDRGRFRGVPGR